MENATNTTKTFTQQYKDYFYNAVPWGMFNMALCGLLYMHAAHLELWDETRFWTIFAFIVVPTLVVIAPFAIMAVKRALATSWWKNTADSLSNKKDLVRSYLYEVEDLGNGQKVVKPLPRLGVQTVEADEPIVINL